MNIYEALSQVLMIQAVSHSFYLFYSVLSFCHPVCCVPLNDGAWKHTKHMLPRTMVSRERKPWGHKDLLCHQRHCLAFLGKDTIKDRGNPLGLGGKLVSWMQQPWCSGSLDGIASGLLCFCNSGVFRAIHSLDLWSLWNRGRLFEEILGEFIPETGKVVLPEITDIGICCPVQPEMSLGFEVLISTTMSLLSFV